MIGVELTRSGLAAVELRKSRGGLVLEKAAATEFQAEEDISGVLRAFFEKHGFSRRSVLSVAPPDNRVFLSQIQTTLPRVQQVRSVLRSQIEDSVPLRFEDIIADISDDRHGGWGHDEQKNLLAVAMSRVALSSVTKAFRLAGLSPVRITPAVSALNTMVRCSSMDIQGKDFIVLHFDQTRTFMVFYKKGSQALVRTFGPIGFDGGGGGDTGVFAREMGMGWRLLFGKMAPDEVPVLISAGEADKKTPFFKSLPGRLSFLSINSQLKGEKPLKTGYQIAAALALEAAEGGRPNFLQVVREEEQAKKKPVPHIIAACVLTLLLVASGVGRSWIAYSRLEQENARLEDDIAETFGSVVPGHRDVYRPVETLQGELKDLQQRRDGLIAALGRQSSPVAVLSEFYRNLPKDHQIDIESINVDANSIRIFGSTGSFTEAEDLRKLILESDVFESADISFPGRRSATQVRFQLDASIRLQ